MADLRQRPAVIRDPLQLGRGRSSASARHTSSFPLGSRASPRTSFCEAKGHLCMSGEDKKGLSGVTSSRRTIVPSQPRERKEFVTSRRDFNGGSGPASTR